MKNIGLALLGIGVAITAAFGARNSAEIHDSNIASGAAAFHGEHAEEAFTTYCEARAVAELSLADGCVDPAAEEEAEQPADPEAEGDEAAGTEDTTAEGVAAESAEDDSTSDNEVEAAEPEAPGPSYDELVATGNAEIAFLRTTGGDLPQEVAEARDAWLTARLAVVEPSARASTIEAPTPGHRLKSWFSGSGVPFVVGLLLVVIGAVIARRAVHAEAADDKSAEGAEGPIDFGQMLGTLREEIGVVHQEMLPNTHPDPAAFASAKARIETFQLEKVGRLIEARGQVQNRYGLGGFAAIFGPLSGAERFLNRTWSALADEHWPEATRSVQNAMTELDAAIAALEAQQ